MNKKFKFLLFIALIAILITACNSNSDNNVSEADAVMTQAALLVAQMSTEAAATEAAQEPTPTNTQVPPTPTNTSIPATPTLIPTLPNAADPATATPLPTSANSNANPTASSNPGNCTWAANFEADITIPDGTKIKRNTVFEKIWRIKNTGTCVWGPSIELAWVASYKDGDYDRYVLEDTKSSSVIPQDHIYFAVGNQEIIEFKAWYQAPLNEGTYRLDYVIQTNGARIPINGGVMYVEFWSYDPNAH